MHECALVHRLVSQRYGRVLVNLLVSECVRATHRVGVDWKKRE